MRRGCFCKARTFLAGPHFIKGLFRLRVEEHSQKYGICAVCQTKKSQYILAFLKSSRFYDGFFMITFIALNDPGYASDMPLSQWTQVQPQMIKWGLFWKTSVVTQCDRVNKTLKTMNLRRANTVGASRSVGDKGTWVVSLHFAAACWYFQQKVTL